jgi:serine/threonine protein kinase
MIGKTLGHYQITSQLGKGGMGEVYQAKDRKLGRDVVIKVPPESSLKMEIASPGFCFQSGTSNLKFRILQRNETITDGFCGACLWRRD